MISLSEVRTVTEKQADTGQGRTHDFLALFPPLALRRHDRDLHLSAIRGDYHHGLGPRTES